jgi:hypothetical protein
MNPEVKLSVHSLSSFVKLPFADNGLIVKVDNTFFFVLLSTLSKPSDLLLSKNSTFIVVSSLTILPTLSAPGGTVTELRLVNSHFVSSSSSKCA